MLIVGLTGGIASGKTAASEHFRRLGVPIIDADQLARELVEPGREALREITEAFGPGVLTPSGQLDRAGLRGRIFAEPAARKRLEAILHPRIRTAMRNRIHQLAAPYVVLVIPLLLETEQTDMVDRLLVVDIPESLQRTRLSARDGSDSDQVERILASQASRRQRLEAADDVIDNSRDLLHLERAVLELHHKYLGLAEGDPNKALPDPLR
jgi:dephospho-CoA kinase